MEIRFRLPFIKITLSFSFWFFAVIALFAMVDHNALLFYIAAPVLIHECGHLVAMLFCRVKVAAIHFSPVGIKIMTRGRGPVSYGRELLVAAGGIAANLLAALLLRWLAFQSMRTMLMVSANLAVAFFNLLPIGSLDGGQMMDLLCGRFLGPGLARGISTVVSFVVLVPLTALSVYLVLRGMVNFTLPLICFYLIITIVCSALQL